MIRADQYNYDVALSFAGEQRRYVKKIYNALNKKGLKVFYDESPEVQAAHLGKRFTEIAQRIYGETADFVVLFVSREYIAKQWPYLEAAYVLDRMRAELFQGNNVLIGKFDDVDLPGFPREIMYAKLTLTNAATFANTIASAVACRRTVDQDSILALFGRENFQGAITSLTNSLDAGVRYEDQVFVLYCRACARSRAAEQNGGYDRELPLAVNDVLACLELVRSERPHYVSKLSDFANRDDDLLALRTALPEQMRAALGVKEINLRPTKTAHLNIGGSGGGCVDPGTSVVTTGGLKPIMDLTLSTPVCCYDRSAKPPVRTTTITHLRVNEGEPRFELNRAITVSSTQPLYERTREWIYPQDLRIGMEVLREDGSFEPISEMRYRGLGKVMVLGVSDRSHTFIANGYVCHNITK